MLPGTPNLRTVVQVVLSSGIILARFATEEAEKTPAHRSDLTKGRRGLAEKTVPERTLFDRAFSIGFC